jgi:O-antigen ligase
MGVLAAAAGAAGAILLPPGRLRAAAMLAALVLFPVLILGDQWHSHQIADLRRSTGRLLGLGALGLAITAALAYAFRRWPILLPLAIVAALPFRVPLHSGGDTANLLVPLYLVIAGGVVAMALVTWKEGGGVGRDAASRFSHGPPGERRSPRGEKPSTLADPPALLQYILAGVVLLYAVQVLYSEDFSKGLQNVCFFFVPFSLVYGLLREVRWDRKLLVAVLWVIGAEAVCFVLVGSIEWLSRSLFWNDQVIRSNEFHTYFRVNSVFWDPNIYGRYLALVAVVAMSALLWARERRALSLLAALIAVVWIGLVPTFSQSSYAALLAGLAVLAALRWSLKWTAIAVAASVVAISAIMILSGSFSLNRFNIDTSGRGNLISGGVHLFTQRPVYGYGSGSFPKAYRHHVRTKKAPVSVSHTEPVTIAAEQGLIGLAAYLALVIAALWTMATGLRPSLLKLAASRASGAVGGPAPEDALATAGGGGSPAATGPARLADGVSATRPAPVVARAAILATFVALLVHTMAYAGFFEDPITWVLLAAAASLATRVSACRDTSAA